MRFSLFAAVATLAAGALASVHGGEEEPITVVVTDYTTYCPKSTSIVHGTETYSVPASGSVTMTGGPYTITRPLITSTVTRCNKCTSSTPVASSSSIVVAPSSSKPVIPVVPTEAPSGVAPSASSSGSATTPAAPVFTGGASRAAAGAGAGLATVFGIVAYLL